jgi:hypothetical protein
MSARWLKLDAQNRVQRTLLQGIAVTVVLPAIDAALQVFVQALTAGGAGFNWGQVAGLAGMSALTAASMAVASYVHRMVLDPSSVPSAQPPRPAGVTASQAPATDPAAEPPRPRTSDAALIRWPDDYDPSKGD